jgi:Putative peptidoglycan binding domain
MDFIERKNYESFVDLLDADDFELFDDIDDVPLDEYGVDRDGDDSILAQTEGVGDLSSMLIVPERELRALGARKPLRNRVVPFARELKAGMKGEDVRALQRALSHANRRYDGTVPAKTGTWGNATTKALREFQARRRKLNPEMEVDGIYGRQSHKALAPHYDAFGISLINEERKKLSAALNKPARVRDMIESAAIFGYNNRNLIHYTQSSFRCYGVRNKILPPRIPFYEDCSSYGKWTYYVAMRTVDAGLADPDGLNWAPYGFTGTLSRHGKKISKAQAALGFYGSGTYSHVVISVGLRTRCVSHGSEGGPYLTDYNYRSDFSHWRGYPGAHY